MALNDAIRAFPHDTVFDDDRLVSVGSPGMTLLDYFAGQALAGLLSGGWRPNDNAQAAVDLYSIAQAMIKERERRGSA